MKAWQFCTLLGTVYIVEMLDPVIRGLCVAGLFGAAIFYAILGR